MKLPSASVIVPYEPSVEVTLAPGIGCPSESVTDPVMVFIAVWAVMMPELTHAVIRQHKSFSIVVIFCSRFTKTGRNVV